jgi:dolichol kinase
LVISTLAIKTERRNKYGRTNHVWFGYSQCRRTLFLFSRQKEIIMGAIIMSVLVSVIAIVGVIYFNYQDKKQAKK